MSTTNLTTLTVHNETVGTIDVRLFGQFLERASFGEPGPEAIVDRKTGSLPEPVRKRLKEMKLPVVRFPGGTDVDYLDWRDMIDHVPGREGQERPLSKRSETQSISNRFGYDEYFALRDELRCETILVLNVMDAFLRRKPLKQAALDAVGLLAYCNAPLGASLPDGMPDWPSIRARNGHERPFKVEYIQIGNEWRFKSGAIAEAIGVQTGPEMARWLIEVLHIYLDLIRAIDPEIKIILDGELGSGMETLVLSDEKIRAQVGLVSVHRYAPGQIGVVRKVRASVSPQDLAAEDWWYGLSTIPGKIDEQGMTLALDQEVIEKIKALGYRIAMTEWNWNGWGLPTDLNTIDPQLMQQRYREAQALGTAGFLHGMMRQGSSIALATQSMLVGSVWDITALRADPRGEQAPYFLPQGVIVDLYRHRHGEHLLRSEVTSGMRRPQPFIIGKWTKWPETIPEPAMVDALVSTHERHVYIHVIYRHINDETTLRVDLRSLGLNRAKADLRTLCFEHRLASGDSAYLGYGRLSTSQAEVQAGILNLLLPPRSVLNIRIDLD